MKSEHYQRPSNYPLTEGKLESLMEYQLQQICEDKMPLLYRKAIISGEHKEDSQPTVALGIFPTDVIQHPGYILEPKVLVLNPNDHQPIKEYWAAASLLSVTDNMTLHDEAYFDMQNGGGEKKFEDKLKECLHFTRPIAVLLFQSDTPQSPESIYLISSQFVPYTPTIQLFAKQAQNQLKELEKESKE